MSWLLLPHRAIFRLRYTFVEEKYFSVHMPFKIWFIHFARVYKQLLICYMQYHRVHILVEMKQGQCIWPLSWSVHCNFAGEGKCNERGWACTPHPHQPGLNLPSSLNVRQKAAVATLCTLCAVLWTRSGSKDFLGRQSKVKRKFYCA